MTEDGKEDKEKLVQKLSNGGKVIELTYMIQDGRLDYLSESEKRRILGKA